MNGLENAIHKRKTSLFARITKSVVLLVVGLFAVTGIVLGIMIYNSSYNTMIGELNEVSAAYTMVVEKELNTLQEKVNSLAKYAATLPGKLSSAEINNHLDTMKADLGFASIYGIDKSGETSTEGIFVNDREYFISAMKGNFYASSPFLKSDNTVGITVAMPVYRNNVIEGVLSVGISYDYFSKFLDYRIGKTGSSYIINKTGTIVADTNTDRVFNLYNAVNAAKENPALANQAEMITNFIGGRLEVTACKTEAGVNQTVIAKPIVGTDGWLLVTSMDSKEINSTAFWVLSTLIGIVIFGVIIGVICAMLLAKSISTPIKRINTRLRLLSDGDLSTEVVTARTGDELQSLSEALRDMVVQLRGYIGEISNVTQSMAHHDLNTQVTGEFKGQFLPIKTSLNEILEVINRSFSEISEASSQVNVGAGQVSNAAQALSQGAVQQASAVEELSSTIALISSQVNQNAESAAGARQKANLVGSQIQESNGQMQQLIDAMAEISSSSGEIGKIIKTIEDIAFQTNILALNAAVEAARAGAAGKGFAVVADEVRNLASKSAEAAKNTTGLIEGSIRAVKNGTEIADMTAKHLRSVVDGAREVVDTVDEISAASSKQASSISEVTNGIEQIAGVVHTNSATAEQSAAASEELSGQAAMLKSLTDQFKLAKLDYAQHGALQPPSQKALADVYR